jgi:prepilin-type N-terminal cleavage/methylation domain-containing protein
MTFEGSSKGLRVSRRGFTLTEIAIVLGIVGLILGAIWIATSTVYANVRLSHAEREIVATTQAIRTFYSTQAVIDSANSIDETQSFASAGAFPYDTAVLSGTTWAVNGPWPDSQIYVFTAQDVAKADSFVINYVNIPTSACIQLLLRTAGSSPGLIYVNATNTTAQINPGALGGSPIAIPVTAAGAEGACSGGNTTSSVAFGFRLKG